MCFVDDDEVPASVQRLLQPLGTGGEEADAAQDKLIVEEGIGFRIRREDCLTALLVEDVEPEIKSAQEFDEPLMDERFGNKDEDALRPARGDQPMQDQTSFDRFPKTHFIRQQHARPQAGRYLGGDVELMRDELDASPDESAHGRLATAMLMFQRRESEVEDL